MNLTVNSQLLAAELRLLNRVVPTKPVLAALSHVLLEAAEGVLALHATDMEVCLSSACPANVIAPGSATLPVGKFLALVEQFPDADVSMVLEQGKVFVRCGAFKSRIQTLPVDDYPARPRREGAPSTLDAATLAALIAKTRYAVSATAAKYVMQGALLTLNSAGAAMAATDGKRLALATMLRQGGDNHRVVLPIKLLDVLAGQLGATDVEFSAGLNHLFFLVDGRLIASRTMDGEFPNYDRILPRGNDKRVVVERAPLTAALRRMVLVAEENQAIYFSIGGGAMELTTASAEVGSADEQVPAAYDGPPLKICVNGRYVLDYLEAAVHDAFTMALKDESSAMLLTEGNDDHVAVIMLMRGR